MVIMDGEKENIRQVCNEFKCFRKSGLLLSSHHKRMIDHYPEEWVAVYNGIIEAHGTDYEKVLAIIDDKKLPRNLTIMRYISKKQRSMIL
jgi:hypothetical protein